VASPRERVWAATPTSSKCCGNISIVVLALSNSTKLSSSTRAMHLTSRRHHTRTPPTQPDHRYESKIAPYAGMPLASMSYTTFVVNFLLLMMHTASAPLSFHILYAIRLMSGFPIVLVL
jgi:hypothetical protein